MLSDDGIHWSEQGNLDVRQTSGDKINPGPYGTPTQWFENEKGYGGFSLRIKMPDGLIFTSDSGQIIPQNLQIKAGPWMDFSAPYGRNGEMSGITLICRPGSPNFPQPWILRQQSSMQNVVFPGREPVGLSMSNPLILKYRLIIHRDMAERNPNLRISLE